MSVEHAARTGRRGQRRVLVLMAIGAPLAALVWLVEHYVPLQLPVAMVYGGVGLAFAGFASILRPLAFLGIRTRPLAALWLGVGALIAGMGLLWPAPMIRSPRPHYRIDDFMSEYQFYERHETTVAVPPARVLRAAQQVRVSDIPVAVLLMRIRAMAGGNFHWSPKGARPILDRHAPPRGGCLMLESDDPGEIVGGMVGRPWSNARPPRMSTPEEFLAFDEPGNIKVTFNMAVSDLGGGRTRLSTETRIVAVDDAARRTFGCYWRVIYPGSAIIRRVWLDAIVALAEAPDPVR